MWPMHVTLKAGVMALISFPDLLWTKPKARSGKVRKLVFLDWLKAYSEFLKSVTVTS